MSSPSHSVSPAQVAKPAAPRSTSTVHSCAMISSRGRRCLGPWGATFVDGALVPGSGANNSHNRCSDVSASAKGMRVPSAGSEGVRSAVQGRHAQNRSCRLCLGRMADRSGTGGASFPAELGERKPGVSRTAQIGTAPATCAEQNLRHAGQERRGLRLDRSSPFFAARIIPPMSDI